MLASRGFTERHNVSSIALERSVRGTAAAVPKDGAKPEGHPDLAHCASLLRRCTDARALTQGRLVHGLIVLVSGYQDVPSAPVGPLLLQLYLKCGALEDALHWFRTLRPREPLCWNFVIGAFAKHGHHIEVFELFERMQCLGVRPDKVTFIHLLSACPSLDQGKLLYGCIRMQGFDVDTIVGTALITMFGRCGSLSDAQEAFDGIITPNVVTWNAMLTALAQNKHGNAALLLLNRMQQEGMLPDKITFVAVLSAYSSSASSHQCKRFHVLVIACGMESDKVVTTALVHMYGKCGCLNEGRTLFNAMQEKKVISWNAIITIYSQQGLAEGAFGMYNQMQQEGVLSDSITFIGLLEACASQLALPHTKWLHLQIIQNEMGCDLVLATALVNAYGKCGFLDAARMVFDDMPSRSVVSWNAMTSAYAQYGHGEEAIQLVNKMQGEALIPTNVTLITFLSACGSQQALAEGKKVHGCIVSTPFELDHYLANALISMYGKCGELKLVESVIDKACEWHLCSWNAIIAAYAQHGDGIKALELLQRMQQKGVAADEITFVSVLTACSHAGMVDEGHHFLSSMCTCHGIMPMIEHYDCMIDALCRAGLLDEAEDFICKMPCNPTVMSWTALLAACRDQIDIERGKHAAEEWLKMDCEATAPSLMLSSMCAAQSTFEG